MYKRQNKNVTEVFAGEGAIAATYDYSPYGQVVSCLLYTSFMDTQTEKEPGTHKKTPPGWLWWSLLGVVLYVLDQASKLWIGHRFPLNYLNEKVHKYAYLPDFPGFHHVNADGTLDLSLIHI